MSTDAQLDRRIRRADRRLKRVRRKRPEVTPRINRLERRLGRLERLRALPAAERPKPLKLTAGLLQSALDVAVVALAATPAGPVLGAVKLGIGALDKVGRAVAKQDVAGLLDEVQDAVRAELAKRGIELDEDDDALMAFADALEDQLEPDLADT